MFFDLDKKLEALAVAPNSNPFFDEGACIAYARQFGDWLNKRLAEEATPAE